MFDYLSLVHSLILGAILLCMEHWEDLVYQVDEAAAMFDLMDLPLKMVYHLRMMHVCFAFPLGFIEYPHGRMSKNKYPSMI